jgi:putative ABC transport system permease protein
MDGMKKNRPPKWADNLLEWYCAPQFIEEIQGDLHEAFYRRCDKGGRFRARLQFILDVVRSFSIRTFDKSILQSINSSAMFKNYLIIAFRNLLRKKAFSLVNILGLAISMAASVLILEYVRFERNYDRFHPFHDRIYRVVLERETPTVHHVVSATHPGVGPALKAEFPEVEEYARMLPPGIRMGSMVAISNVDDKNGEKMFFEENIFIVDPSFLRVFSFPFIQGNSQTALDDASSIAISESMAKKYFGSVDPMGKTLMADGERNFKVTGVFKDIPHNSHIKFDMLVSWWFVEDKSRLDEDGSWKWPEFFTYVRLAPGVSIKQFEAKLKDFHYRHNDHYLKSMNIKEQSRFQLLTDIHLKSPRMDKERAVIGSEQMMNFLLLIAVLILSIAWINYINLSTSNSVERAKEVGLRKVVGALKKQLVAQFLFESAAINFIAISLSLVITFLIFPYFSQLTGRGSENSLLDSGMIQQPVVWLAFLTIFLGGSLLAGLYPAFVISSFKIATVLRGKFFGTKSGIAMRKVLVGTQFVISIALIAGTIMIFRQVQFMRNHDLGYAKDQLLIVRAARAVDSLSVIRKETFKSELKSYPQIKNVSITSEIPGALLSQVNYIRRLSEGTEGNATVSMYFVDHDFASTFGLKILAGRNFGPQDRLHGPEAKSNPIMLNRKIVEMLGYKTPEEAVNQLVNFGLGAANWTGEIIGITENFSQQSLRVNYEPLIFFPAPFGDYFAINLDMKNVPATVQQIKEKFDASFPGNPFEYFFMDDHFNRQYASDQQFAKVFGLFTALALVIAGLGLYGLTLFMISQRTKEMAIRRTLGASISNMVRLFSTDFIKLIIIANLITLPVTYYLAGLWLDNFAFRISIGWLMFVIPPVVLLIISLSTVSFQTIKTGLISPVKSLRSE